MEQLTTLQRLDEEQLDHVNGGGPFKGYQAQSGWASYGRGSIALNPTTSGGLQEQPQKQI